MKAIVFTILFYSSAVWCQNYVPQVSIRSNNQNSDTSRNEVTLLSCGDEASVFIDKKGTILGKLPIGLILILPKGNMVGRIPKRQSEKVDSLLLFDNDLNIIWEKNVAGGIHHDITADDSGNIYFLSSCVHLFMGKHVRFDCIQVYSPNGDSLNTWCVFDHLNEFIHIISKSAWCRDLPVAYDSHTDPESYIAQDPKRFFIPTGEPNDSSFCSYEFTHFNSIQVLPYNEVSKTLPAFKKGNLLLSFNPYSSYGILNITSGKIEWNANLPERTTLHTPKLNADGKVLVFQNSTENNLWANDTSKTKWLNFLPHQNTTRNLIPVQQARLWASITAYDPATNLKCWEYVASPKESMRVDFSGSAQKLANGNILVSVAMEHKGGKQFELTPQKKVVWQYISPEKDHNNGLPYSFYRAIRINADEIKPLLNNPRD